MADLQEVERALQTNRAPGPVMAGGHLAYMEELVREYEGRILVAEDRGQLLGFVICLVDRLDAGDLHVVEAERRFGYISDLYVVPPARGRGVGSALLQAVEAHFRELGLTTVQITALYHNDQARTVYERNGFVPYELTYRKEL
jgi:ribosomal protein S18 acetylase RimI-like enzyme